MAGVMLDVVLPHFQLHAEVFDARALEHARASAAESVKWLQEMLQQRVECALQERLQSCLRWPPGAVSVPCKGTYIGSGYRKPG